MITEKDAQQASEPSIKAGTTYKRTESAVSHGVGADCVDDLSQPSGIGQLISALRADSKDDALFYLLRSGRSHDGE